MKNLRDEPLSIRLEADEPTMAQALADVLRGSGTVELNGRRVIPTPAVAAVAAKEETRAQAKDGYHHFGLAAALLVQADSDDLGDYDQILRYIERALELGMSDRFRALALRRVGEIHLRCGDVAIALEFFQEALLIDPKVGVARLAAKLRKW
ncbi:MAG: hypothetical protein SFV32_12430 [Opitutaceae bacterium]|nr:hypothetical protein [Opitutaceae bacterium]